MTNSEVKGGAMLARTRLSTLRHPEGRLPDYAEIALRTANLWHSPVTEAELASVAGLLDPTHPETQGVIAQVAASINLCPAHRILAADWDTWREAGMLAGLLGRLQSYDKK